MRHRPLGVVAYAAIAMAPTFMSAPPAAAQQSQNQIQEVIVTARKRQESILNVPVVETALTQQQLERLQTQDMKDIASLVPGLTFTDNVVSVGTQVSLRGIGTTSNDPGVDQSVSLNLDGLSLGNGLAFMSGVFDAGQVEVLKGPQALFYGKSSPGGVISIRSADPTSKREVIARVGYEAEARERRGELIVSGPLTDTIKARLAGSYSQSDGYFERAPVGVVPGLGALTSPQRLPAGKSWMLRGTVLWNPSSQFDARLKLNNVHDRVIDPTAIQIASCPGGTGAVFGLQFLNPKDDCRLDRKVSWVEMDPRVYPGIPEGGRDFIDTTQTFGTLELNYHLRPDLTLTSTTAYYLLHSRSSIDATASSAFGPSVAATNGFSRRQLTEELRANSDFSGPFNFTAGGFFERGKIYDEVGLYGNTAIGFPGFLPKTTDIVHIKTESVFGQARYKILPQVELAAGARWTDETRTNSAFVDATNTGYVPITLITPRLNSKNVAPEITVTYKPSANVTLFGAYKQAYKSGSFSLATPGPDVNQAFGDEKVRGGEVGLKSRLLDRSLSFNIAAFDYKYTGLQVGAITPARNGLPTLSTVNAGSATTKGFESDVVYHPPQVEGLSLHADLAYTDAKYNRLDNIPCFGGQTIAQGCTGAFNPTANSGLGGFTSQDDSGLPLVRSAKWQAHFGFDWETPISQGLKLIVANSNQYSSRYLTNLGIPYYQKAFIKTDLSLTLEPADDRWEIALIGKNLGDKITTGGCINFNGRGAGIPGLQTTGTTSAGPAGQDAVGCFADRGRQLWVRFTYKPLN